ncbi:MAG: hypothetical protein ABSB69_17345, partial [Solirubrobacteraceae bacterium]
MVDELHGTRGDTRARRLRLLVLVLVLVSAWLAAPAARAGVVAVDPSGAAVPVLWDGGVAWQDEEGVRAASPGEPTRKLVSFKPLGFTYRFALDAGAESQATATAAGPLAYGWEEADEMTPPMGPGDTSVPAPALPYETSIVHRGVIAAGGAVTPLPCTAEGAPFAYGVSLSGASVAYNCQGVPPGAKVQAEVSPSYVLLGNLSSPGAMPQTIDAAEAHFQVSGDYLAYVLDEGYASVHMIVEDRATAASYEVPKALVETLGTFALGADGTLVLISATGGTGCSAGASTTVWLSPSSPTPHPLGCFYDGSLRVVGGQWVGLQPGPGGQASLELVTIASGASRTLATFANAGVFAPTQQSQAAAADFDGQQLAWTMATCAGAAVEYTPEVSAMTPSPPGSPRCPVRFIAHGVLRPSTKGIFRVGVSCPLGCPSAQLSIAKPAALAQQGEFVFRAPPSRTMSEPFRLSRRQLRYLRRHHRIRVTLVALSQELGKAAESKYVAHVT